MLDMKLRVFDRQYQCYEWNCDDGTVSNDGPNPLQFKLLDGDQYTNKSIVRSSRYRTEHIAGVLNLAGSTYGRYKGKLLYKCYPDCKGLPTFLVPYQEKPTGFSKLKTDAFVQIELCDWDGKHPIGKLTRTIGYVSDIHAFAEYLLVCKDVNHSIQKINKATIMSLAGASAIPLESFHLEDRSKRQVFAIDPPGCLDADDAMGISPENEGPGIIISVYISAVPIWVEALGLWDIITTHLERVSTIYFPDERRPMLPAKLSEYVCSLQAATTRPVLAMDIVIRDGIVVTVGFSAAIITLETNYIYESESLLANKSYLRILDAVKSLNKTIMYKESINDSHDVVEFLMLMMNHRAGQMLTFERGMFRTFRAKSSPTTMEAIPPELKQFVRTWGTEGGQYTTNYASGRHDMMPDIIDVYAHVTSPIRRIADLVNMILILEKLGVVTGGLQFVDKWMKNIDVLNARMKAIRKVQNDVSILSRCSELDTGNEDIQFDGFIIAVEPCMYRSGQFCHNVFLPQLGCVGRFQLDRCLDLYHRHAYNVYVFKDADSLKHKVRVQLIE
jgi:exoribonuclease R